MTQNEMILRHLETIGSIDPMTAIKDYGIMRLASRIADLKKQGYAIVKENVKHVNRFGESTHYAKYKFLEEGADNGGRVD